jgi:hypothetical protein
MRAPVLPADDDVRLARLHELDRPDHRGVPLLLEGDDGLVVHRDDLRGVLDRHALAALQAVVGHERAQHRLVTDEGDGVQVRVLGEGELDRRHDLSGAHVPAHRVDRDPTG